MLRPIHLCAAVLNGFAACLAAQTVVTGTGDPNVDVPAVQAAVDQGGRVLLMGHFSFDTNPTKPAGASYSRMVTVSRGVAISGKPDENDGMPTIEGGFFPFYVEAPGSTVAIEGLRFVRPKGGAIWVYAVSGLVITACRIEGVDASAEFASYLPTANPFASPIWVTLSKPENYSGTLLISNNDIDAGATAGQQMTGIYIDTVGKSPDKEVDLYIFGNTIRNISDSVIDVKSIGGRVHIERNVIETGQFQSPSVLSPRQ